MASCKVLLIAAAAMVVAVVGALLPATASAAATSAQNYLVGDEDGWDMDVDYELWADGKTFFDGDTLEFHYTEGSHNVVILELDDWLSFLTCTVIDNAQTLSSGNDRVTLSQAGQWFFICDKEDHCDERGMSLAVNVAQLET